MTKAKYSVNGEPQTYKYAYKSAYDDGIKAVTLPNGKTDTVTTDNFGRMTKHTLNTTNAIEDVITYKSSKSRPGAYYTTPFVSQMECKAGSGVYARYTYEYDANRNITSIYDYGTLKASYDYDGLNRLVREQIPNKSVTVFLYDKEGNITCKKIFDYETHWNKPTYELFESTEGQTVNYSYMQSGNKDRLLSYNGSGELTYDSYGNPKQWFKHGSDSSEIKYALGWSQVNRLTEITDTDNNQKYVYTYDYNGIRTSKQVGNTLHKYYLDGSNIIAETRTTNGVVSKLKYYYGTMGLVGFNYNGTDYYYQKNVQGDIVRIYNNSGTLYGEYRYDAWGKCTVVTDKNGIASINPFRYRGYYLDNETGLCYLNSRYYDPTLGRFLSPDRLDYLDPETLGGLNLYAYCNNNPVMYVDPSGTIAIATIVMIIFATVLTIVGGVIGGIVASNNGADGWGIAAAVLLGMSMGFAAAGLIFAVGGAVLSVIYGTSYLILGLKATQIFAIGALMYNFTAMVVAPIYGITMIAIDFKNDPYKPDEPGETPRHPADKHRKSKLFVSKEERDYYDIGRRRIMA